MNKDSKKNIAVYIIIGSKSDLEYGETGREILGSFGANSVLWIASAHRSPHWLGELVKAGEKSGVRLFICAAGGAAHLPGVVASLTSKPVLGVGLPARYLAGLDSLLSMVQMPSGVPVAFCGLGETGMKNAAHLALQILALEDANLALRVRMAKKKMEQENKKVNKKR